MRLKLLNGSLDSCQCSFSSQHFQRLKQWWRVLASANGYSDRLKHLTCLDPQFLRGGAQGLIQRVVLKFRFRQDLLSAG
jgi:hypothetical protein